MVSVSNPIVAMIGFLAILIAIMMAVHFIQPERPAAGGSRSPVHQER